MKVIVIELVLLIISKNKEELRMLSKEWTQVDGFSNMGEDDETIAGRMYEQGVMSIGFLAYGGLKVADISGVTDATQFSDRDEAYSKVIAECGDDWEVAVAAKVSNTEVALVIDSNGGVATINLSDNTEIDDSAVMVSYSEEYDSDGLESLMEDEYDLLDLFGLV